MPTQKNSTISNLSFIYLKKIKSMLSCLVIQCLVHAISAVKMYVFLFIRAFAKH